MIDKGPSLNFQRTNSNITVDATRPEMLQLMAETYALTTPREIVAHARVIVMHPPKDADASREVKFRNPLYSSFPEGTVESQALHRCGYRVHDSGVCSSSPPD